MNFIVAILCIISLFPTNTNAQPAQPPPQTCSSAIYVGNTVASTAIFNQTGHGAAQSVIAYDTAFTIPCTCGLLTGWELIRYDSVMDGCTAFSCHATLMVYRNLNTAAMTATLVGYYNATKIEKITPTASNYIAINIPTANWIPIKYGDYLGWEGSPSPVTYYEESPCSGACPSGLTSTKYHFYGSNKSPLTAGSQIAFFNGPTNNYAYWRYFGFRAIVFSGTAPYFTSLPKTLTLNDSITVGTVVWSVKAADKETKTNLTLTVLWTCPLTSYFYMNPATGDVTLIKSLFGGPAVHTLAIEVSDDCFTADDELTINVISTLNTTLPPPTVATTPKKAPNPLRSPVGASLLAITILASLVAIGSSIGMCVLGSQMASITKELGEIPSMKNPQTIPNNEKIPNYRRENPLVNRKPYPSEKSGPPHDGSRTRAPWQDHPRGDTPPRLKPTPTPTTHGSYSPSNSRLTPVEQRSKATPSPRASSRNYPPRDMLYW